MSRPQVAASFPLLFLASMANSAPSERLEVLQPVEFEELTPGSYLKDLPEFIGKQHGWEIVTGEGLGSELGSKEEEFIAPGVRIDDSGVNREYADGYSAIVDFSGYSSTGLCAEYKRTAPIDGHTECPLERSWHVLWPPVSGSHDAPSQCFIDNIRAYQNRNTLNSPPGTEVRLNRCPGPDGPDDKWHGGYDWRYGGIRPQDNPDMQLFPEVKAYIEDIVAKHDGRKVVVKGYSGGTIAAYAFLMSMSTEWRQKNVMAFLAVSPVFGGTVNSINSVIHGWARGPMTTCCGREAALYVPSVAWMWPRPGENQYFWNRTEVLVWTETKNYTAYDLVDMLKDMGLNKVAELLQLEQNDLLKKFAPPMVDTYAFYGYGKNTVGGYNLKRNVGPETDGEGICPPGNPAAVVRPWDNGDGVGTFRSTARAGAWEEEHKRQNIVLKNYGYENMGHSCSSTQCKKDYDCVLDKLKGNPRTDC